MSQRHVGMRCFEPLSERAHEWMGGNFADESAFLNGELVGELRYADEHQPTMIH